MRVTNKIFRFYVVNRASPPLNRPDQPQVGNQSGRVSYIAGGVTDGCVASGAEQTCQIVWTQMMQSRSADHATR